MLYARHFPLSTFSTTMRTIHTRHWPHFPPSPICMHGWCYNCTLTYQQTAISQRTYPFVQIRVATFKLKSHVSSMRLYSMNYHYHWKAEFRRQTNGLSLNWSRFRFALILDESGSFCRGSVLMFTKMSESEIKESQFGCVSQDFESGIKSEYNILIFATDCRMFSDELMCVKAAYKSEYKM